MDAYLYNVATGVRIEADSVHFDTTSGDVTIELEEIEEPGVYTLFVTVSQDDASAMMDIDLEVYS